MKDTAYGKPILLKNGEMSTIHRIDYANEATIQNLVFDFPDCLPISDIDEAYNPCISVCKELRTPTGYLDILMVTPNGELVIIETKLWRNPEARRKVIAQILDYANELSNWTYEDLQRELNRNLDMKGNTLYNIARKSNPDLMLSEADFVDNVSRNLQRGKFLLLIVGDGIKEGAASITEFLTNSGHLNFTFGMIELTFYELSDKAKILLPRTIVKTVEIQKLSIELPEGLTITNSLNDIDSSGNANETVSPQLQKQRAFFKTFWEELINEMEFDDPGQPMPRPTITNNLYVYPGKNKYAWISAYFAQSSNRVGVYFRCQNDQNGQRITQGLEEYKQDIRQELGEEVIWSWDSDPKGGFGVRLPVQDVYAKKNRERIKQFFAYWINQFVNALRPRMKEFQQ